MVVDENSMLSSTSRARSRSIMNSPRAKTWPALTEREGRQVLSPLTRQLCCTHNSSSTLNIRTMTQVARRPLPLWRRPNAPLSISVSVSRTATRRTAQAPPAEAEAVPFHPNDLHCIYQHLLISTASTVTPCKTSFVTNSTWTLTTVAMARTQLHLCMRVSLATYRTSALCLLQPCKVRSYRLRTARHHTTVSSL